jgi:hypothetical protein
VSAQPGDAEPAHTISHLIGARHGLLVLPLIEPATTHQIGLIVPDRDPVAPVASALLAEARHVDVEAAIQRAELGEIESLQLG